MYNIYRYCFSLLLVCCVTTLTGQKVDSEKKDSTNKFELNSLRVEVDVSPIITTFLNRGDIYQYESAIQAEINNRFYPVFEIGYAGANKLTTSGINYQGNAIFYRLGMDFNLIKNQIDKNKFTNYFLIGARLGHTNFNYKMQNITFENEYWDNNFQKNIQGESFNLWFEISAGIRVEIYKRVYIGWTARIKNLITKTDLGDYKPWYIPGFGINGDGSVWAFNYMLGYKF
ncbi:MAG: DUF6048 family protein [Paludibacter sp.]|nr:DUF6048 family protein [Paludibacter sp.]